MAFSKIDIASMALIKVGGEPITSFTDGTRSAQVVSNLYDQTKQSLFYSTFWNFATEKTTLARLTETPTDKSYKFVYQAPGDVMRVKGVFDESGVLNNTYSYEQNKLYTNLNTCNLIYIKEVSEANMPPFFSEALVSKLAYEICEGVTGVATKSQRLAQEYEKKLRFAKVTDAQETPPQSIVGAGHLVEARISGSTPSVIKERFN
mgnify:CR=1 FL=1